MLDFLAGVPDQPQGSAGMDAEMTRAGSGTTRESERARARVTLAIRNAVRRISGRHPSLGYHLATARSKTRDADRGEPQDCALARHRLDHRRRGAEALRLEGKYLIQTEEKNLTAVEAVRIYKDLSEVERAFANLKDVIELRPIYHQTDERVQAHVFVAALAFLLHRAVEKKLKAAGLDLSATEALQALRSVRVVDLDLGAGRTRRCVTRGTQRAASILAALKISELDPPTPPKEVQTLA